MKKEAITAPHPTLTKQLDNGWPRDIEIAPPRQQFFYLFFCQDNTSLEKQPKRQKHDKGKFQQESKQATKKLLQLVQVTIYPTSPFPFCPQVPKATHKLICQSIMADRFFPNIMPDFVAETPTLPTQEAEPEIGSGSLMKLLSMPYPSLSERFKRTALDLKETILIETWGATGQHVQDFTLYAGALGTALLLFKSYQVTSNTNDLSFCSQIIKACDSASLGSRDVTFICGRAGVCALGAVAAKHLGDSASLDYYLAQFREIKLSRNLPDELLYGKVGFLWACLFFNKHLGEGTISSAYMVRLVSN